MPVDLARGSSGLRGFFYCCLLLVGCRTDAIATIPGATWVWGLPVLLVAVFVGCLSGGLLPCDQHLVPQLFCNMCAPAGGSGDGDAAMRRWLQNVFEACRGGGGGLVVELCCGTKSVGAVFEYLGFRVISVDHDVQWNPDILLDITSVSAEELLEHVRGVALEKYGSDVPIVAFWASPQCTEYAVCNTTPKGGERDLIKADRLVGACLALFAQRPEAPWFMENPGTGLLRTRRVVEGKVFRLVDYCKYSSAADPCCPLSACPLCGFRTKYRKETAIWTNTTWQPKASLCRKGSLCGFVVDGRHEEVVKTGKKAYPVPGRLTREIAEFLFVTAAYKPGPVYFDRLTSEARQALDGVRSPRPLLQPPPGASAV